MPWQETGFRRTLKLQIIKTEANPDRSGFPPEGITYIIDGNKTNPDFTGITDYNWGTGETMARASIEQFNSRKTEMQSFVATNFPDVTNIIWDNTRIGASILFSFSNSGLTDTFYTINATSNGDPVLLDETVRIKISMELDIENYGLQAFDVYHYILKNTGQSIINISDFPSHMIPPNMGGIKVLDLSYVEIKNISNATRDALVKCEGGPYVDDDVIVNQHVFSYNFDNFIYGD